MTINVLKTKQHFIQMLLLKTAGTIVCAAVLSGKYELAQKTFF